MTPSWYDLLDVDRCASAEEIRRAWKSAIADLEPTDRRFRTFNDAAGVLLDPARRAEYDATLEMEPDVAPAPDPADHDPPARADGGVPLWLLGVLGLLALALVVITTYAFTRPEPVDESRAQAAAEAAVGPVLSYDYRTLEEDAAAAKSYMTPDFQERYDEAFTLLQENATRTKTVVSVEPVLASGIVRSGPTRVDVLLFVNRPTKNVQRSEIFRDQVTMQMKLIDGEWLVDGLVTTPAQA